MGRVLLPGGGQSRKLPSSRSGNVGSLASETHCPDPGPGKLVGSSVFLILVCLGKRDGQTEGSALSF